VGVCVIGPTEQNRTRLTVRLTQHTARFNMHQLMTTQLCCFENFKQLLQ